MSRRNFRRFNPNVPLIRGSRRPTDKELIVVNHVTTTSNVLTTLKTATFPCTVVGLRWNFAIRNTATSGDNLVFWIIVLVHDGQSANTLSTSNGADMYTPENDVMAFGTVHLTDADLANGGPAIMHVQGQTKTMRKMQQGDLLQFITLGSVATGGTAIGTIQFFCKS